MKIEDKIKEVIGMWQEDVKINETELSHESLKIPILHGKYLRLFSEERLKLRFLKIRQKQLMQKLTEYYNGELNSSPEDLAEIKREPYAYTRSKGSVIVYVENDKEIIDLNIRISYQQELVEVLEEIIKAINNRGFVIKNSLDFIKFINGERIGSSLSTTKSSL